VRITPPPSPDARCAGLVGALPTSLGPRLDRRSTTPASAVVAAWGDPAVVLSCGAQRPSRFSDSTSLEVDGMPWSSPDPAASTATWRLRDEQAPYVEVRVPQGIAPAGALGAVVDALSASPSPSAAPG
jgi:hypothetical protein